MRLEDSFCWTLPCTRVTKHSEIAAYPGDGSQGGREAQLAGPPAGRRGPEAGAGLAAEGLAWLQRNLGVDSGAGLCDLYLFIERMLCYPDI